MTARDIITDLLDLTYPLPGEPEPGDWGDEEAWQADHEYEHEVRQREEYEEHLRLRLEHEDGYDPLIAEIEAARDSMLRAEARRRLLIAYGREFTRPRPYRLEDLARAAGMSISGIRTAYDEDEIAEVARLTGTRPRRPSGGEP
jgi:hypothetical protein